MHRGNQTTSKTQLFLYETGRPRGPKPPPNPISRCHQAPGPGLGAQQVLLPQGSPVTELQSWEGLQSRLPMNKGEVEVQRGHWNCPGSRSKVLAHMGSYPAPSRPRTRYRLKEAGCHRVFAWLY